MQILGLYDSMELSENQRHMSKIFDSLQCVVETEMSNSLPIYSIQELTSKAE